MRLPTPPLTLELGPGTLIFVGRLDLAEIGLKSEEVLMSARRSFYAGMTALPDALSALNRPRRRSRSNGRTGLRSVTASLVAVVSAGRRLQRRRAARLARLRRRHSPRFDEEWRRGAPSAVVLARRRGVRECRSGTPRRRLCSPSHGGSRPPAGGDFVAIAQSYLARLRPERGIRRAIEASGNLRVERLSEPVECLDLRAALAAPSWLDRETKRPRR